MFMKYEKIKKCGRCHKEYIEPSFKINELPFEHVVLRTPIHTTITQINLCPDCARDLFHFLCGDKESED